MLQTLMAMVKWAAIPALLIASTCSRYAASYELMVNAVICLGAILFVPWALWMKKYFWAVGSAAIAVVFSPLLLVVKVFLLLGLVCLAAFAAVLASFRARPVLAD